MFQYIKDKEVRKNRLKEIRVELGLTITALSKFANVSTKVISQTERMLIDPTRVTKSKIVNGLNAAAVEIKQRYVYEDIFSDDQG